MTAQTAMPATATDPIRSSNKSKPNTIPMEHAPELAHRAARDLLADWPRTS